MVGCVPYEVEALPADYPERESHYGAVDYGQGVIYLHPELSPHMRDTILWHEVLHILLHQAGFWDEASHDERQIWALAYRLPDVLRDNPWLMPR